MGRPDKKRALRLFLYLRAAGRVPTLQAANYFEWAAMLSKEYGKLTPDVRKHSRSLGRKLIRAAGLNAACQSTPELVVYKPQMIPRSKCSTCRVKRLNKPKSIWGTKEEAEAFCSYFRGLAPYPCPAGNGWHVTHRKR